MRYDMHLNKLPYKQIVDGRKNLEVRLNDAKRQMIAVGDEILFENRDNKEQTILKKVVAVRNYASFAEVALNEDCVKCGFEANYNTQDVVDCYANYYGKDDEKRFGVVVFELQ